MKIQDRIAAVELFVSTLRASRDAIIASLMWEICKNTEDAAKEFDRTMDFGQYRRHHTFLNMFVLFGITLDTCNSGCDHC